MSNDSHQFSILFLLQLFILFSKHAVGTLQKPYETYRRLAGEKTQVREIFPIFVLVLLYFWFTSLLRIGVRNPYLLTVKFNFLVFGGFLGFISFVLLLYVIGKFVGGEGSIRTVSILWAYTLLPTLVWFFTTSILYVLLPPPRSFAISGKLYSFFYTVFTLGIVIWKCILSYLTIRFSLKLGFLRITAVGTLLFAYAVCFSLIMYALKIFRVPFI